MSKEFSMKDPTFERAKKEDARKEIAGLEYANANMRRRIAENEKRLAQLRKI